MNSIAEMLLLCLLLLAGVPSTRMQAADDTIPIPSNISISFRNDSTTTVDVHWTASTASPFSVNDTSLDMFSLNITYVGPCGNYSKFDHREPDWEHPIAQYQVNVTYTLYDLQEFSNYSVSIEGVSFSTLGRSSPISITFQTKVGRPSTVGGISVIFVNSSAMSMTWQPLSCLDKNGIISAYDVMIVDTLNRHIVTKERLQVSQQMQPPSSFTFTQLSPSSRYTAYVAAVNTPRLSSHLGSGVWFSTNGTTYTGLMLRGRRYFENGLVDVEDIAESDGALLCLTTHAQCCSSMFTSSMMGIGEWYYPNDTKVPVRASDSIMYRNRWNGTVRLNKRSVSESDLQGIFTCVIPDSQERIRNFSIGIFPRNRGILTAVGGIHYERVGASLFHFSFVTTGGPATTVRWERDNVSLYDSETTVVATRIINKMEATYAHMLNVSTHNATGYYRVAVSNRKSNATSYVKITSIAFQVLFRGAINCELLTERLQPQMLFSVMWSSARRSCSGGVLVSVAFTNGSFICSKSGEYLTLRGIFTSVERNAIAGSSSLSCLEQWTHTSGSNIIVQGFVLHPIGDCPTQISSLDQLPCVVLDSCPPRPTESPDSTCTHPLPTASSSSLPLVIVLASILLIASITVNVVLIIFMVKLKMKARKQTTQHGFSNHLNSDNETRSRTNSKSIVASTESENEYYVPPDAVPTAVVPGGMAAARHISHSHSAKECVRPTEVMLSRSSQSSHALPLVDAGDSVHLQTFGKGKAAEKPKVAKKPKRMKEEQKDNSEIAGVGEGAYASLIEATRQKVQSYEQTVVQSTMMDDDVIYIEPEEVYDDVMCASSGRSKARVYYGSPPGAHGEYKN